MAQAGSLWVRLGLRSKEFNKGLTKAQARTKAFTSQAVKLGAALGAGLGIIAVVNLTKKITTLQAEFSSMMSRVNALTSATTEMSAALRIQAQILGQETQFTATQAAEAMTFLAQAGLDVNQIYEAMPNTLELAAVGQIQLAEAADISTNIMSAYGLQAEDLGRVNDIIANTTTKANTNVREFAEAFKMVGPIARSANQRIEDISAQIGILANAGIKGTMAGTALRTMISKLINPTGDAADILEKFGIVTTDTAGNMRPLNDILSEMRERGIGLKDMFEIFDLRAAGSADVLKALSGSFEDFADVVGVSGTASRVAAEQMNNLKGDLLRVTSAWEGALLSLGQGSDGFMRSVAQNIAGLLNWITPQEKLSETLIETRIQMNAEINALKSGNITGEARVGLIDKINRQYKDYLPRLITEKTTLEDLNILQAAANELLFDKIKLRAQEEILEDELKKVAQAQKTLLEEQIKLEKMRNTEISKYATSLAGMQSPAEAHALATGIQAGKVESLVEQLKEAKKAFDELKAGTTFATETAITTAPTPTPTGGGGVGLSKTSDELKKIEEEAETLDNTFIGIRETWDEFGNAATETANTLFPIINELEEGTISWGEIVKEQQDKVIGGYVSMAEIIGRVANGIANAKKNWAAMAATILSGVAQMVPQIQGVIAATKALFVAKQAEAVAGAAASSQSVPFPLNLIALASSVGAVLASIAPFVGSFETGTDFVPFTGLAQLHKGEAVIPASENRGGRSIHITGKLIAEGEDLVYVFDEINRKIDNSF